MEFPEVKKIGVVATARKISRKEINPAVKIFNDWGLEVVFGKNLFNENHQFSGTDNERAADIQNMIDNPEIGAIVCARGGYGTARIVDKLDFSQLHRKFKWLIGYSDVTVLHNAMAKENLPSLHATMPINFAENDADSLENLKHILLDRRLPNYHFENNILNRIGKTEASIVGGNLSVIYSLRSTNFDLDVTDKILFIEDLDEYLYHIDRMIINFKLSGWFHKIKGLIIGGMEDMNDNTIPFGKNAREIIADAVKEFDFPLAFIDGVGHTNRNLPLVFGRSVKMEVDKNGTTVSY